MTGSQCRGLANPGVIPRVRAHDNIRIPDLAVVCNPPAKRGEDLRPVLLIEILTPSNATETWANVWAHTTITSVMEILVVSSTAVAAELLRRGPDGDWPPTPLKLDHAADLSLEGIGMRVPLLNAYRTSGLAA